MANNQKVILDNKSLDEIDIGNGIVYQGNESTDISIKTLYTDKTKSEKLYPNTKAQAVSFTDGTILETEFTNLKNNFNNLITNRYTINELGISYINQTASFPSIVGHYYIVGANVLHATNETPGTILTGAEQIMITSGILRSSSYNGLLQDSMLILIRATHTTVQFNLRAYNGAATQFECIQYCDLGSEIKCNKNYFQINQKQGSYYITAPIVGHYYLVFASCLHSTGEYVNVKPQCIDGLLFKYTTPSQSAVSSDLFSNASMGIALCTGTNFGFRVRDIADDSPRYQNTHWIDLGPSLLSENYWVGDGSSSSNITNNTIILNKNITNYSNVSSIAEYLRYSQYGNVVVVDIGGVIFSSAGMGKEFINGGIPVLKSRPVVFLFPDETTSNVGCCLYGQINDYTIRAHVPSTSKRYYGQLVYITN